MKDYIVSISIPDKFSNGSFRFFAKEMEKLILSEIKKFNSRQICKKMYNIRSEYDPVSIFSALVNASYSDEHGKILFDKEIDTIYIMPLENYRVINGKTFNSAKNVFSPFKLNVGCS